MSTIKVPDVGQNNLLNAMVSGIGTFYYHLYKNNYTPVSGSTAGDFTEADFDSYSYQTVTWGGAGTNGADQAEIDGGSNIVFTDTGSVTPNTIYGYYVTDSSFNLLWAEQFDSPQTMSSNGDSITITPSFRLQSIY